MVYLYGCMTFTDYRECGRLPRSVALLPFPLEHENLIGLRLQLFADEEHAYKKK